MMVLFQICQSLVCSEIRIYSLPWQDLQTPGTAPTHVFIRPPLEPNAIPDPPCLKRHDGFPGEKVEGRQQRKQQRKLQRHGRLRKVVQQ